MKLKLIFFSMILFSADIFTAAADDSAKPNKQKLQLLITGLKQLLNEIDPEDKTYSSSEDESEFSSDEEDVLDFADPLVQNIKNKKLNEVKKALRLYIDINHRFQSESTLLHIACKYGIDYSMVDFLIKKGIDINAVNARGWTALFYAIMKNSKEVVKLLLKNGAAVNIVDKEGCSPIAIAIARGYKTIFKMLIEFYGANFKDFVDSDGANLLFHAVRGPENEFIIKYLIENGVDPMAVDKFNSTAFHSGIETGHPSNIKTLINLSEKISENVDDNGHTPLSLSIIKGKFDISELLIKRGANVTWVQSETAYSPYIFDGDLVGYNLLHWACSKDNSQAVIELLFQSIDINSRSRSGRTPLMVAFRSGNEQIVRFLLSLGAKITLLDKEYKTCLHHLMSSFRVVRLDIDWIKTLVNIQDIDGNTPLHLAVEYANCFNNIDYIKLFIENGADLTIVNNENFKASDLAFNDVLKALFKK